MYVRRLKFNKFINVDGYSYNTSNDPLGKTSKNKIDKTKYKPCTIYQFILIFCNMLKGKQLFFYMPYLLAFSDLHITLHFKDFQKLVFKFFIFIESKKYNTEYCTLIFGFYSTWNILAIQ
jgi:hypothetical protein